VRKRLKSEIKRKLLPFDERLWRIVHWIGFLMESTIRCIAKPGQLSLISIVRIVFSVQKTPPEQDVVGQGQISRFQAGEDYL
jgi:hypothetical protein